MRIPISSGTITGVVCRSTEEVDCKVFTEGNFSKAVYHSCCVNDKE